jgi:hypothetical protein
MKVTKTLALALMLMLTGLAYAAGGGQQTGHKDHAHEGQACCSMKDGGGCCAAGAECCTAGAVCCKADAECCKDGASCCAKTDAKDGHACAGGTCPMKGTAKEKKAGSDSCCKAKVARKAE